MRKATFSVVLFLAFCATQWQSIEREIRARYDELERAFGSRDLDAILDGSSAGSTGSWRSRRNSQPSPRIATNLAASAIPTITTAACVNSAPGPRHAS